MDLSQPSSESKITSSSKPWQHFTLLERNNIDPVEDLRKKFGLLVAKLSNQTQLNGFMLDDLVAKLDINLNDPEYLDDGERLTDIDDFFDFVRSKGYMPFYSLSMLRVVVDNFAIECDSDLEEYKSKYLLPYLHRCLSEVDKECFDPTTSVASQVNLTIKVDREWDTTRMLDIVELTKDVAAIINVRPDLLVIKAIKAGSVILECQIPQNYRVTWLSYSQMSKLDGLSVIRLECDGIKLMDRIIREEKREVSCVSEILSEQKGLGDLHPVFRPTPLPQPLFRRVFQPLPSLFQLYLSLSQYYFVHQPEFRSVRFSSFEELTTDSDDQVKSKPASQSSGPPSVKSSLAGVIQKVGGVRMKKGKKRKPHKPAAGEEASNEGGGTATAKSTTDKLKSKVSSKFSSRSHKRYKHHSLNELAKALRVTDSQGGALQGIRLSTDDHYDNLFSFLRPHADKWQAIGEALGFRPFELYSIQIRSYWSRALDLCEETSADCLGDMLTEWLQWAPGDGRGSKKFATFEDLRDALLTVPGMGTVAYDLGPALGLSTKIRGPSSRMYATIKDLSGALQGTRLRTNDHYDNLCSFLCPYADQWRAIGSALGFHHYELYLIQQNSVWSKLFGSETSDCLGDMLTEWLQWAPGDGRGSKNFATFEDLRDALLTVPGMGTLAYDLGPALGIDRHHDQWLRSIRSQKSGSILVADDNDWKEVQFYLKKLKCDQIKNLGTQLGLVPISVDEYLSDIDDVLKAWLQRGDTMKERCTDLLSRCAWKVLGIARDKTGGLIKKALRSLTFNGTEQFQKKRNEGHRQDTARELSHTMAGLPMSLCAC